MPEKAVIRLNKITTDKLETMMKWRMSPEVSIYMYTDPKMTMKDQERWWKDVSVSPKFRYWMINMDGKDIGVLNLYDVDPLHKRCFWAYYLGDTSMRGQGLGRQLECNIYDHVFFTMDMHKLCCEVLTRNEKVIAIHQKFGSEIEGTFKEHIHKNGEFLDIVRMGILKKKWEKIRSSYEYDKIVIEEPQ